MTIKNEFEHAKRITVTFFAVLFFNCFSNAQSYLPYIATVYDSAASQGYYFIAPKLKNLQASGNNKDVNMILDKYGEVVYYRAFPAGVRSTDFKLQPNGKMTYSDIRQFYVMDSSFNIIDSVRPKNGLHFDGHDFQILPSGNYIFIANELIQMDLSSYKLFNHQSLWGSPNAIVKCGVVQELDPNKNVVFEFHTKDHFKFDETDHRYMYNPAKVDWTHSNAVELDNDGNILLSSRDFNEITKINRSDGSVMWRWGGKKNQFSFINDPMHFRTQHDIRRMANGNLTVFDNGFGGPFQPATAKEYVVDETNKTATMVWSYIHDSTHYSDSRGNFQRLANGNNIVSYGYYVGPNIIFSCVKPSGSPVLDVVFIDSCVSYRAFNYSALPWNLNRPKITCEKNGGQIYLSVDSGLSSYKWNTGDTTFKIAVTSPGTYSVFIPRGSGGFIKSEKFIVTNLLSPCPIPCQEPAQPGLVSGYATPCFGTTQTYSISPVASATDYTWDLPPGWMGISTTNSITVNVGPRSGKITVVANNACGSSLVQNLSVDVSLLPSIPGILTGDTLPCPGATQVYSIAAIPGATNYTWSLPAGCSGSSNTNTISVLMGSSPGTISVNSSNVCGTGPVKSIYISPGTTLAQPSIISGSQNGVCGKSNLNYSVTGINGMTYNWSFSDSNASVSFGQGSPAIKAGFSQAYLTGSLSVTPTNGCGIGPKRTVFINAVPKVSTSITGPLTVCLNQQGVPFSIGASFGATSYTWSGPTGSRFSDGITTSTTNVFTTTSPSVTVNFKTTPGLIKVKANNACGSGTIKSLAVSFTFNCRETMIQSGPQYLEASPNPVKDNLTLSFILNSDEPYELLLTDLTGRFVHSQTGKGLTGKNKLQMDVSKLSQGLYFLKLFTNSGNNFLPVVVVD